MKNKANKFGQGDIYSAEDLVGKIYITSAACMSVFAESLGWANANSAQMAKLPEEADNILVLSCQVTDLAVLNDFETIRRLQADYPGKKYFIGGCLAQRFDIPLPAGVDRLEHLRADYQELKNRDLVNYEKPFWVKNFDEKDEEYKDGHLFRNMYPLRIGVGCKGKCSYCTIKTTRCGAYNLDPERLEKEFSEHDNILLVADNISPEQIKAFCALAKKYRKVISVRNMEPHNVVRAKEDLLDLAKASLLKVFHTPVQAYDQEILQKMCRSVEAARSAMEVVRALKALGVFVATNIIIDFGDHPNDFGEIYALFDYVSWNPLWNGQWDEDLAKKRFKHYLEGEIKLG